MIMTDVQSSIKRESEMHCGFSESILNLVLGSPETDHRCVFTQHVFMSSKTAGAV